MPNKANSLAKLASAIQMLNKLDELIDVDRLVHISNAQGPQARLLRAILDIDPKDLESSTAVSTVGLAVGKALRPKPKRIPGTKR